jgi:hypothetical protein
MGLHNNHLCVVARAIWPDVEVTRDLHAVVHQEALSLLKLFRDNETYAEQSQALDSMLYQSEYLSKSALQAICSSCGLSTSGTKDQLRDAIFQDVSEGTCAMEASPPTEACSGVIHGFAEDGGV